MSHFTTITGVQLVDSECLVEALKDMSFHPVVVEQLTKQQLKDLGFNQISADGKSAVMHDWHGRTDQNRYANIILRRREIGGAANDNGFLWNDETGQFDAIISQYDSSYGNAQAGQGLGPQFLLRLKALYNVQAIKKTAASMGLEAVQVGSDRFTLRVPITSRKKTANQKKTATQLKTKAGH